MIIKKGAAKLVIELLAVKAGVKGVFRRLRFLYDCFSGLTLIHVVGANCFLSLEGMAVQSNNIETPGN